MTLRTMYDSVTAANLPTTATLVAAYVDGAYANVADVRKRCPKATVVTITVKGGKTAAHVVDVEQGDCTPASGAAWAKWRHDSGAHPTIYCSHSDVPDVIAACRSLGLALHRDFELWVAHYDGVAQLEDGAVAKQYRNTSKLDTSIVAAHWPGVDPDPIVPPHLYRDAVNRGYFTVHWTGTTPHADVYAVEVNGRIVEHTTSGQYNSMALGRLHGTVSIRVLATNSTGLRVWSNRLVLVLP